MGDWHQILRKITSPSHFKLIESMELQFYPDYPLEMRSRIRSLFRPGHIYPAQNDVILEGPQSLVTQMLIARHELGAWKLRKLTLVSYFGIGYKNPERLVHDKKWMKEKLESYLPLFDALRGDIAEITVAIK